MRYLCFFSIALALLISCQTNTKTEQVDLAAVKNAVNTQMDNFYQSYKARDIDAIGNMLADDCLFCGTDPGEFWDKEQLLKLYARMFANESLDINYSIDKREIRLDADGNSVIILEQGISNPISKKIPYRGVMRWVKIGDDWKADFFSVSLIPKNADLAKLNKAIE